MDRKPTEKDLIYYLATLEVAANSVAYCFEKNAGNFALALSCMKHDADQARKAIARWKAAEDANPFNNPPETQP